MRRLAATLERLRESTYRLARDGAVLCDRLQATRLPTDLDVLQDVIRANLLHVEQRQSSLRWRVKQGRRAAKLKRRFGARTDFGAIRSRQLELLKEQDALLSRRREVLRMLGDACAWAALRMDARLIAPLFLPRPNTVPQGIGLAGPVALMNTMHASGRLLAVQNDLTRCLGNGDLTVAGAADFPWERPIPLEIKSSGEFREGAEVTVSVLAVHSDYDVDENLYETIVSTCGLLVGQPGDAGGFSPTRVDARAERQMSEMVRHGELLVEMNEPAAHVLLAGTRSSWPTVTRVLRRAEQAGAAFDIAEDGVAYLAAQGDALPSLQSGPSITERLQAAGFSPRYHCHSLRTLRGEDATSAFVEPIFLWKIPADLRAALAVGRLELFCVHAPDLWEKAFARAGLSLSVDEEAWLVTKTIGGKTIGARFDPLEVKRLRLGLAFGALSASDVAGRTSILIDNLAAEV